MFTWIDVFIIDWLIQISGFLLDCKLMSSQRKTHKDTFPPFVNQKTDQFNQENDWQIKQSHKQLLAEALF